MVFGRKKRKERRVDWGSPSPHSQRWDEKERQDAWRSPQRTPDQKRTWGYRPSSRERNYSTGFSSGRGNRRLKFGWGSFFLIVWVAAFGLGLALAPGISIPLLLAESFFDGFVVLFFTWGIAGITRRGIGRKALSVMLLLLLVGIVYQNPGALAGLGPNTIRGAFDGETNGIMAFENSTQSTTAATSATASAVVSSLITSSPTQTASATSSASSLSSATSAPTSASISTTSNPGNSANWLADSPDFQGTAATIDDPPNYQTLLTYALSLINQDRASAGLSPVSLSPIQSGQQHADSMAYHGYFSHWDPQGYKPYMRYSLLGGTGAVAENIGSTWCTTSPVSSTLLTQAPCSLQNLENGLANSEWGMMNNDAVCCANGHRENILDPTHNRVSLGIAYVQSTGKAYLVEDFEDASLQLTQPIQGAGSQVQIAGTLSSASPISQLLVYYDANPSAMTTQQLDATSSYAPGSFVGGVLPPCSGGCEYYPTGVNVYASLWQVGGSSIDISFSMSSLFAADGPGVYTLYLDTGDSTGTALLTYSVFYAG